MHMKNHIIQYILNLLHYQHLAKQMYKLLFYKILILQQLVHHFMCEFINNRVLRNPALPGFGKSDRFSIYSELNSVLSQIHSLNINKYKKELNYNIYKIYIK